MLASKQGLTAFVSDKGKIADHHKETLQQLGVDWEEGMHSEDRLMQAQEWVVSPGIPLHAPLLEKARRANINLISEVEFAWRYCKGKVIGITGSNGKTTTTLLTYHILKKAGLDVCVGGNVGKSFAGLVASGDHAWYVIELSSFQLDGIQSFRPHIAILLNITPDHLDRYEYDFNQYVASKFRIGMNQTEADHFIFCQDDPAVTGYMEQHPQQAHQHPFSLNHQPQNGAYATRDQLFIHLSQTPFAIMIHQLALQGKHNLYNSMAAAIAARILDIRNDLIRESLTDFQNIEHRLELVGSVHGIRFINDSKATNVNSVWYALESMEKPVIWIAGGIDKGNDYSMLDDLVKEKVKALICLGTDNTKLRNAYEGKITDIQEAHSAEEAVKMAYRLGRKGDTVLLSPACSSFDLFENYEDRGRQFKQAVRSL